MQHPWFAAVILTAAVSAPASAQGILFGTKVEEMPAGQAGVKVLEVTPNSPAAGAGVDADDVIVKMGEVNITNLDAFTKFLDEHKAGDVVAVVVRRGGGKGEEVTLQATLGKMVPGAGVKPPRVRTPRSARTAPAPDAPAAAARSGSIIVEAPKRTYLGVSTDVKDGQLTILEVIPETPAARAGLRVNDRIVSMDGQALSTPEDLRKTIRSRKPGETAKLRVKRDSEEFEYAIALGEAPDEEALVQWMAAERIRAPAGEGNVIVTRGPLTEVQVQETAMLRREVAELRSEIDSLRKQIAELRSQLQQLKERSK